MEKFIFKSYLYYTKKEEPKLWDALTKLPITLKVLFGGTFLVNSMMLLSALIPSIPKAFFGILLLISTVIIITLNYKVEFYKIEYAEEHYDEYKKYCEKLKVWLFKNWIGSKKEVKILIKRMKKMIDKEKNERQKFTSKVFDIFKILVIPVILVMITSYVDKESNFITALSTILGVSLIIIIFVCFGGAIWSVYSSVKVKKVAQMERFVDDLQSILDICFDNIYCGKAKENTEEQKDV